MEKKILVFLLLIVFVINLFSQSSIFPFRKGTKFHYSGVLETDTINKYPNNKSFSIKDYNYKTFIKDLIISVDTVISKSNFTFIRFSFDPQKTDNKDADFFFVNSQEPNNGFNLIIADENIYTISPTEGISNPINFKPELYGQNKKIDSAINEDYKLFYKKTITSDGCLNQIIKNSSISSNGKSKLTIPRGGNEQMCNFEIHPFLSLKNRFECNTGQQNDGTFFYCFLKNDSLTSPYGGKVKIFKQEDNSRFLNFTNSYYYSDKYFISKMTREFKWDRSGRNELRQTPPCKYELTLFKIEY
ncbi:MAG: hypothetical protein J0I09_14890 [Sphingobacteriia bacterium]|nr:hypothetical protein [Sphingobacteriia bacterium]